MDMFTYWIFVAHNRSQITSFGLFSIQLLLVRSTKRVTYALILTDACKLSAYIDFLRSYINIIVGGIWVKIFSWNWTNYKELMIRMAIGFPSFPHRSTEKYQEERKNQLISI